MSSVTLAGVFQRRKKSWCNKCSHLYFKGGIERMTAVTAAPAKWNLLCHLPTAHCMWPPHLQQQRWVTRCWSRRTRRLLRLSDASTVLRSPNRQNCTLQRFHMSSTWKVGQVKAGLRSSLRAIQSLWFAFVKALEVGDHGSWLKQV